MDLFYIFLFIFILIIVGGIIYFTMYYDTGSASNSTEEPSTETKTETKTETSDDDLTTSETIMKNEYEKDEENNDLLFEINTDNEPEEEVIKIKPPKEDKPKEDKPKEETPTTLKPTNTTENNQILNTLANTNPDYFFECIDDYQSTWNDEDKKCKKKSSKNKKECQDSLNNLMITDKKTCLINSGFNNKLYDNLFLRGELDEIVKEYNKCKADYTNTQSQPGVVGTFGKDDFKKCVDDVNKKIIQWNLKKEEDYNVKQTLTSGIFKKNPKQNRTNTKTTNTTTTKSSEPRFKIMPSTLEDESVNISEKFLNFTNYLFGI